MRTFNPLMSTEYYMENLYLAELELEYIITKLETVRCRIEVLPKDMVSDGEDRIDSIQVKLAELACDIGAEEKEYWKNHFTVKGE